MDGFRLPAVRLLWWAALAEFLLVRVTSRAGIYIPKAGVAFTVYHGLVWAGEMAFNLSLLAVVVVLLLTLRGWRGAVAAVATLLVVGAPGAAAPLGWSLGAALAMAAAVAVLATAAVGRGQGLVLTVVMVVQLLVYGVTAAQLAWAALDLPDAVPGAGLILRGGELLALLAPVLLVGSVRRWTLLFMGVGAAAALGAAYLINPDITAILAMYSLGFSMSWPVWLYLGALGLGLPALVALTRRDRLRGLALALLFLAGYSLTLNQQHLLVLAGWAVLALPAAQGESAAKEVAAV